MDDLADLYRHKLNLPNAVFTYIDHEDAMVAAVFKISQPGNHDLILKVCSRKGDFLRESYFLSRFADKIPVPKIIQLIEPEVELDAAILMECVQGDLLKSETITSTPSHLNCRFKHCESSRGLEIEICPIFEIWGRFRSLNPGALAKFKLTI